MRKLSRRFAFVGLLVLGVSTGALYMDTNTAATTGAGEGNAKVSVTSNTVEGGGVHYVVTTPNFEAP